VAPHLHRRQPGRSAAVDAAHAGAACGGRRLRTGRMSYALATLWHERQRFLPGILATAFSALLIVVQCGLLLGLFAIVSMPIDHSSADVWVGSPQVMSVDL